MTVNDFFRLILKLFALYCIVTTIFSVFPGSIGTVTYGGFDLMSMLWLCFVLVFMLLIFILLAFQSDKIIAKLKLSRGFENPHIPFEKLDAHAIISIGCIIIGGLVFLDNLPHLLTHLYIALRMSATQGVVDLVMGYDARNNTFDLVINVLNMAISYLLLTNYAWVSKKLAPREEGNR